MIIGIDYSLSTATNRGMGRYVREIVKCLMKIDSQNHYILYTQQPIQENIPSNFQQSFIPTSNEIVAEQWHLPRLAKKHKIDVLWCPGNTFPLILNRKIKLVVTIHDLIFMLPTQGNSTFRQTIGRIYRKWVLKLGKKRIDHVLTVSTYSALEIESLLKIKNVKVAYNCIDTFHEKIKNIPMINHRKDFYFTLSGDAPSKNLQALINIFKAYFPFDTLVIGGVSKNSLLRNQQNEKIIFLDYGISDIELIQNYKSCKAFIFLSLREGFGIPILEALICDAPIVCSNTTSIPEVAGEFALFVDPTDTQAIVEAIKNVDKLKNNTEKKNKHIKKFLYWNNSAQIIKDILTQ